MSDLSCDSIWQPLHTPSAKLSGRAKKCELLAQFRVEEDRLGPAVAGAEHVAVREAAAGNQALEAIEPRAAREQVGHVHVGRTRSRRDRTPRPSRAGR